MAKAARTTARLTSVRRQINRLDEQLLKLINSRARLALEIGQIKKRRKWPVFDASREGFVLRHVIAANRGPLSSKAVQHVFQAVLCECRRREKQRKKTVSSVQRRAYSV